MPATIVDLRPERTDLIEQGAALLHRSFQGRSASWQSLAEARTEVLESLEGDRISRVLLDDGGRLIGWVGGIPLYEGCVLEVHPLVVDSDWRGRGLGRRLLEDLEAIAAKRGASTLFVGTDDENGETSVSRRDLWRDVPGAIRSIGTRRGHPYEFYQKVGFTIVGLLPDANGPGKPDILMAKPVGRVAGGAQCDPRPDDGDR
jgi:aminoglycoside 6'-N-acetyltransferase I